MKWVERYLDTSLVVWVGLLFIVAVLSVWLCSIIEFIGNEFLVSSEVVVGEFWLYEVTLQVWNSVHFGVIFAATAILIMSGVMLFVVPQSCRVVKSVKLGYTSAYDEDGSKIEGDLLEEPVVY